MYSNRFAWIRKTILEIRASSRPPKFQICPLSLPFRQSVASVRDSSGFKYRVRGRSYYLSGSPFQYADRSTFFPSLKRTFTVPENKTAVRLPFPSRLLGLRNRCGSARRSGRLRVAGGLSTPRCDGGAPKDGLCDRHQSAGPDRNNSLGTAPENVITCQAPVQLAAPVCCLKAKKRKKREIIINKRREREK